MLFTSGPWNKGVGVAQTYCDCCAARERFVQQQALPATETSVSDAWLPLNLFRQFLSSCVQG